ELQENGAIIAELRGTQPRHFCYPSGRFSDVGRQALREEGILSATTCETGLAAQDDNPLMLPRLIDTMRTPLSVFEAWVTGAAAFLPRRGGRDTN
ncbi:MAG TPA: hypothetical protein VFV33_15565, partial [Gemmatimonadaceae bacterium]|nr:hypothetical protein [Gemmatimonadaceae bacterium]